MMLFKPSTTGVGRLEICTAIDNNATTGQKVTRHKEADRKVIRLSDCLSVTPATEESCPPGCTALYLNTMQSRYTLASTASQAWHSALCHLAFQVNISPVHRDNSPLFLSDRRLCSIIVNVEDELYPRSKIKSTLRK